MRSEASSCARGASKATRICFATIRRQSYPYAGKANTGDGHRICMKAGADFWHMHGGAQYWLSLRNIENTPVRFDVVLVYGEAARHHRRRERTKVLPGLRRMQQFQKICAARYRHNSQRRLPTRHHAVRWRYGAPSLAGKGWFVFDQAGLDAGACPEETSTDPVGDGWAVSADTLEELAKVIEVPEDELLKTVKQWERVCGQGRGSPLSTRPS